MTDRARADVRLAWLIVGASAALTLVVAGLLFGWAMGQARHWAADRTREMAAQRRAGELAPPVYIPAPSDEPVGPAEPIGNPSQWLGADDYPAGARRRGEEGRVTVSVAVGPDGVPTGCQVLVSSGSYSLDNGTCTAMLAKAQFRPDPAGRSLRRWISPPIRWQLPG